MVRFGKRSKQVGRLHCQKPSFIRAGERKTGTGSGVPCLAKKGRSLGCAPPFTEATCSGTRGDIRADEPLFISAGERKCETGAHFAREAEQYPRSFVRNACLSPIRFT